jgi:hypothetical protein
VATITTLPAVALILADTELWGNPGIPASAARPLSVAAFLALAASLATRLRGEVWLIVASSENAREACDGGVQRLLGWGQ